MLIVVSWLCVVCLLASPLAARLLQLPAHGRDLRAERRVLAEDLGIVFISLLWLFYFVFVLAVNLVSFRAREGEEAARRYYPNWVALRV